MQKLKEVASRCTALVAAIGLLAGVASTALPALVSADALNPLTERTLLLSSSAPGFIDTDGSGNSTYAPPNSGPNGKKSGETFTFKVSTDSSTSPTVKAFTFQYCTTAAGECTSPGNDSGGLLDDGTGNPTTRGADDSSHSDLNVVVGSGATAPTEITTTSLGSDGIPNPDGTEGNFGVESSTDGGATWTLSPNWNMSVSNLEDSTNHGGGFTAVHTGKNNYITLKNSAGINPAAGTEFKVVFYGTDNNYITNPGSGAFFVKINDYDSDTVQNFRDNYPTAATPQNVIDGGVTVANVMNDSIQIRTKVLETLDFSVGVNDPDTDTSGSHSPCDPVNNGTVGTSGGVLYLGDPSAENSLSTQRSYDTFSYWRLSSNSSNGATVYYSGNTLADTEGDQIGQVYDLAGSHTPGDNSTEFSRYGSEQFGLGLDVVHQANIDSNGDSGYVADYNPANSPGGDGQPNPGLKNIDPAFVTTINSNNPNKDYFNSWHLPQLYPLVPNGASPTGDQSGGNDGNGTLGYGLAHGSIGDASPVVATDAQFGFSKTANTIPVPIASESNIVVNCSTGLMRYLGNIAATTPAGIYTTKINYLAAPEY